MTVDHHWQHTGDDPHESWKQRMKAVRGTWRTDIIHNGDRQRFLAFARDDDNRARGVYIEVNQGLASAGAYDDAVPTIGDADFHIEWSHRYDNFNQAFNKVRERMG